jgi:branched-chain amino acid transport system substrate-binding protein
MTPPSIARVRTLAALAAVGLLAAGCGGQSLGASGGGGSGGDSTVKVGLLVSESGVYSSVGRDMENGFKYYLEQHGNKLGGKKVDLVTVDEGGTPQSGVAGVTRLVQQDQVDTLVGIVAGPTAAGGRDILDSAGVPTLLGNTGSVALGKDAKSDWIWRASYDNGDPGRALGAAMAKDSSAGNFFLIGADYSGGHETIGGFKQTFPADRIAGELYTPFGTTSDYSSYLSQIQASGAKNVFSFYAGGEAIEFTKQFNQFGLAGKVNLYSAGFLTEGAALDAEGQAALGVYNATRYNWDIDTPGNKQFEPGYEKKYGTVPTVYAATMYDVGVMLDKALAGIHGDVSRQAINDALKHLGTVHGARGDLHFDSTHTVVQNHYLTQVKQTDKGLRNVTLKKLPTPSVS